MSATEKGYAFAGGVIGGVGFVAGLWLFRSRLAPVLRQNNHAAKPVARYDPVAEIVRTLEKLRAKLGKG